MTKARSGSAINNAYFPSHSRCLPNGNYDPIQCIDRSPVEEMCFCVNVDTMEINGTMTYQSLITDLKCYDETIHNPDYHRPCEKVTYQRIKTEKNYSKENRLFLDSTILPVCSPDGYFEKVQVKPENTSVHYCSDRDGMPIEDYEAVIDPQEAFDMNCECAFARKYMDEGLAKPVCERNGNYRSYQCMGGRCYCVDKYGRQYEEEVDQLDIATLNCDQT